jgi:N-acetylmuramoyl-L-alanine amidase
MKKFLVYFCLLSAILSLCFSFVNFEASSCYATTTSTEQTDTIPSRNYTIVIDAGHGGSDPGSIGYKTKVREADLNLKISKMLQKKLEDAGINVVMTRTNDESLIEGSGKKWKKQDMEKRKELIKDIRPNMVVSIHQNSYTKHSLRGAQVFYDKTSEISKEIANSIQEEFIKNLDHSNKYASPGDYFMLKCTIAPSIIVECGFLSNEEEEKLLLTDEYQEKIVNSIYLGIIKFLQIK